MAGNDYHFVTRWRVESTVEEIADIIGDAQGLMRWWPSVYLRVHELAAGEQGGVGKVTLMDMTGWLPFTLRCQFRVTESRYPYGFTLQATGDLVGQGIWTFEQEGSSVRITYDWKVRGDKPLLRYLSFLLKGVFAANHHWAMAKGEESLRLEVARRHAATPEALALIPAPPGPRFAALTKRGAK